MAPHSLPHSSASAYFRHRMMSDTSTPSDRCCVSAGGIYTSLQGESKYIYHYHRTRYVPCDAHSAVYKDDIPRVQQSIKPPAEGAQQKNKMVNRISSVKYLWFRLWAVGPWRPATPCRPVPIRGRRCVQSPGADAFQSPPANPTWLCG